jgi:hypothetical protein
VGAHFPKAAKSGRWHAESEHPNIPFKKGSDEILTPFETDIKIFREITPGEPASKPKLSEVFFPGGLNL